MNETLQELYHEKKRIDRTIARLEERMAELASQAKSRRGRRSMSLEERLEVSRRISAYWAAKRDGKARRTGEPAESQE